jgi:hypothetical protein
MTSASSDSTSPIEARLRAVLKDPTSRFDDFLPFVNQPDIVAPSTHRFVLNFIQTEFPRRLDQVAPDRAVVAQRVLERIVDQIAAATSLAQNRIPNRVVRGPGMTPKKDQLFVDVVWIYQDCKGHNLHLAIQQLDPQPFYELRISCYSPGATRPAFSTGSGATSLEALVHAENGGMVGAAAHMVGQLVREDYSWFY